MSRGGDSGYRMYVFEESTRRCAIDRKGRGRKKVIYLRITIREVYARARGSPMEAPTVGFRDTTPPPIEAELRQRCGYYIYIEETLKVKKEKRGYY